MKVTRLNTIARNGLLLWLLGSPIATFAQQTEIKLWPGVGPGSDTWTHKEVDYRNAQGEAMVRNVVSPSITVFLPDRASANGTAIIVAPGGGMRFLSWDSEGTQVAQWFSARGVAAFVLKYRLNETPGDQEEFERQISAMFGRGRAAGRGSNAANANDPTDVRDLAIADGKQALKVVRQHASEWGIAPDRVGLMGFSAGATLTMGVLTSYDAESRPNFAASIYGGTVDEAAIPSDAPPLFILCAADDQLVPSTGSSSLYAAWRHAGHSAELHIYSTGGHGFGMHKLGLPVDHWVDRLGEWMGQQGLLKPAH